MTSKRLFSSIVPFLALLATSLSATPTDDGLYAIFRTNKGDFTAELFYEQAPLSCANMVGLAEGTIAHYADGSDTPIYSKFYDGLTFHRIVDGFVIQGGDPAGNGAGGPGYSWPDEVSPDLKHSGEGFLSMANSGPNTNGSQFFVTLDATSHLNGLHNVFGQIVEGMGNVTTIGKTPTDDNGVPDSPVTINKIEILRIGESANAFDPTFYANHFDPFIPAEGQATDSNTQVSPVSSGKITVSTPFKGLTEYRVLTSNDLENWTEESYIQPSLDPDTTPPEYQLNLPDDTEPKFVRIDATKRNLTDVSDLISEIKFESGTEANPYTESIKFTSSQAGTYALNADELFDVDLEWFEINNKRNQLKVTFENGTFIQFYLDRSNGNQGALFLRDNHYEYNYTYQQWVLIDTIAEGTFEITPVE